MLQKLKFLRHLTLKGNPICSKEGYRDTISTMLPNLESLDGKKVCPTTLPGSLRASSCCSVLGGQGRLFLQRIG